VFIKNYKNPILIGIITIAVFLILSLVLPSSNSNMMARVLIMMLFATSVNIMFGYTGLIAFGQAIFFGTSAYAYTIMVVKGGLNIYLAFVLAVLLTTLASVFIGMLCLRVQAFTFALLFMGLNILAYNLSLKIPALGSGSGIAGSLRPQGFTSTMSFFYLTLVIVAICYIFMYIIVHSSYGKIAQGIRENEERLVFIGINIKKVKLLSIIIASLFTSVAGILYSMLNLGAFTTYLSVDISTEGLIMCLVGGMFSFWGPSIGAILITFINVYISNVTIYYHAVLGIILIVTIIFFPSGILGQNGNDKSKIKSLLGKLTGKDNSKLDSAKEERQ
jgi:branched-chain amino acid transport system permease protein